MRAAVQIRTALLLAAAFGGASLFAQSEGAPAVLDSVVAVVNNHAILASDIDRDMRLTMLEPESAGAKPDRRSALDQLISRELIDEQMTPEEAKAAQPTEAQIKERLASLRADLPACARYHCDTDAGWAAFLAANVLTQGETESYLRTRTSLLAYIENRFRQGIRISQEEIETYYRDTLVPQYPAGQEAPKLESVAPHISEILLQQQVTQLFSAWLDNLRKQGDVEILDPDLAPAPHPDSAGGTR